MRKNTRKINISNMIALCHIVDEYDEFEQRLIPEISLKYNRDYIYQLWSVSNGELKIGAKKAKKFYQENKSVIDTINKYSNIPTFINENYNWVGKPNENIHFFYNYLQKHKEEIPKILEVLNKTKELRFKELEFDEEVDFTKEIYEANPSFDRNFSLIHVANPQTIPNYLNNIIYKTNNSNYKMELKLVGIANKSIAEYGSTIIVNSLLFDPKTLPEKIDKEHMFDDLFNQKEQQNNLNTLVRNTVNLSIAISDLEKQYIYTNNIIEQIDDITNKEELLKILLIIKEELEKLKLLNTDHENIISTQEPQVTPELLKREKRLYLDRRDFSNIDLC